jgi:hypothetical protein
MSIDKINKKIQQLQAEDFDKMPTGVANAKKEQLDRLFKEKELLATKTKSEEPYLYIVKDDVVYFNTAIVNSKVVLYGNMGVFEFWFDIMPKNVFKQIPISLLPDAETIEERISLYKELTK